MKQVSKILILFIIASLLGGCAVFQRTSPADVATQLSYQTSTGERISVTFPKNMQATKLRIYYGEHKVLETEKIITDASTVIDSSGAANAAALAEVKETINHLAETISEVVFP